MITETQVRAIIERQLNPIWPTYDLAPGRVLVLCKWFEHYEAADLEHVVNRIAQEQFDNSGPRQFWTAVRREMDDRYGWRGQGDRDEHGFTPAERKNIIKAIKEVRRPPLRTYDGQLNDDQLWALWLEREGYTTPPATQKTLDGREEPI